MNIKVNTDKGVIVANLKAKFKKGRAEGMVTITTPDMEFLVPCTTSVKSQVKEIKSRYRVVASR